MENIFEPILSEQLSSVVFVQDYLQLDFDGPRLTCYTWPTVTINNQHYNIDDVGYRDALCKIISHIVQKVILVENQNLQIVFDSEYQINLKLIRENIDQNLAEFAYFQSDNTWFVLD